jgi:hypothetical protein
MSADTLLARLDGVRKTGPDRWLARCPAHDDRKASLAIRELPDGRVLVKCFAECETECVLSAVGLDFSALYPPRPLGDCIQPVRRPFPAADVLQAVSFEALFVLMCARTINQGETLCDTDRARLLIAVSRLERAVEVACHA